MTTTSSDLARPVLTFMNSPQGRAVRSTLGTVLLTKGNGAVLKGLGAVLLASGPLDFCPTNVALGYPLSGEDTRRRLGQG